jgi:ATP-dependent protease Clp ATPase subunit
VREELQFSLRDWMKSEDLFDYGITPQFLSRFDAVVLLAPLAEEHLLRVFMQGADSGLKQSQAYFASQGVTLEVTDAAAHALVREAARQPRLGARALKEVFRRVIRGYEFEPRAASKADGRLVIDTPEVDRALANYRRGGDAAISSAGWDASSLGTPTR